MHYEPPLMPLHNICIALRQLHKNSFGKKWKHNPSGEFEMSNEPCSPLILALDDASAQLEQVGGKVASLARLASAGLPVRPGFSITPSAYRPFVAEHGLQEQILAAAPWV